MKILSASFESPGMLYQKGPRALPPFFVLLLLSVTRGTFYLRAHLQMCQNNIYLPKSHFWCVLLLCPRLVKRGKRKVCTDPLFSPVLAVLRGGNRWQAGKGVACIRRIVIPFYFLNKEALSHPLLKKLKGSRGKCVSQHSGFKSSACYNGVSRQRVFIVIMNCSAQGQTSIRKQCRTFKSVCSLTKSFFYIISGVLLMRGDSDVQQWFWTSRRVLL